MTPALLTWAYDGSGVALRVPVTCHPHEAGPVTDLYASVRVSLVTTDPEIIRALNSSYEVEWNGDRAVLTVPQWSLSPLLSLPDIQSWNWND